MAIYDPKSMKADEFINNEEIIETIAYAEQTKTTLSLSTSCSPKPLRKKAETA